MRIKLFFTIFGNFLYKNKFSKVKQSVTRTKVPKISNNLIGNSLRFVKYNSAGATIKHSIGSNAQNKINLKFILLNISSFLLAIIFLR